MQEGTFLQISFVAGWWAPRPTMSGTALSIRVFIFANFINTLIKLAVEVFPPGQAKPDQRQWHQLLAQ